MKGALVYLGIAMLLWGCVSRIDVRNEAIARNMFDAFNRHDWNGMTAFYADSALFLDPSYGKEFVRKSRAETAAKYAELQKMFPDIRDEITGVYSCGDVVTVEFVSTGTMGDSIRFTLPIVSVLTFSQDGQIVRDATYYDLENP